MELEKAPTPLHEEDSKITLTIRLIMQGKEVGSIIGKKGEIVKRFREESGAKINISDGSCPERIVTVTGNTSAIFKAFTLICKKFEEWCSQFNEGGGGGSRAPITLRLIVPASQCGSLIGKGGSKIKEIRDVTGANIQVASEMLPNSTERAVTISGTCDAITQCIYHICCVMLESPPKGATIPYRPKPNVAGPVILAGGQAYTIQGNYAVPAQDAVCAPMFPLVEVKPPLVGALPPHHLLPPLHEHHLIGGLAKSPLAGLAALGLGGLGPSNTSGLNPAALAALAGSQLRTANQGRNQPATNQQSHEMTVPNELIGCIIGKGGTKIAEIRQISGAMIRISNCEEREGGSTDRTITITGNPDSVALAQYLINMSVELQKANLESSTSGGSTASTNNPLASAIPLAQLLTKTGALGALNSLSALGGLTDLLSGSSSQPVQTTGVHRNHKSFTQRRQDDDSPSKSSKERNKYTPY
ncbi:PREDICTED: poly(rC)-binding protein 3 isoform X1 [Papilio polytes]|uniref:poly(rC)-binding protein 3 isoform X1 n=1 Tax=Papilio polytes TaxID=76194 RepID=UPI0006762552|nr:PREDICTED: poly(rC)-binding protein 3 isoform X1 [Papilio polytes]XP_013138873.1 PREDICTED: poly(rC)-binding protein 3 isoform X1 [Papilio polytes]XP_013138874.1 PREDICTED: poly(rC)-binding protein 3 isoform X1 [Papilio polytes]